MRIDLYLKQSRLIKRRTIAQEACEKGLVFVNGNQVKQSYKLKLGDIIILKLGLKQINVKVTSLVFKKDEMMYDLISEQFLGQK